MKLSEDLELSAEEQERLLIHWQLVKETSRSFNLTAVLDDEEAAEKHYRDCLAARDFLRGLPEQALTLDLGSGAGFPGLVLAAVFPDRRFFLLDATAKKCDFLVDAAASLGLANVEVVSGRAEELARGPLRESFALVTARAVAALRELVELALPLLEVGGALLALKGAGWAEEVAEAQHALAELSGEVKDSHEYTLSAGDRRCLLQVTKTGPTPDKYPRRPGMPHKRPL